MRGDLNSMLYIPIMRRERDGPLLELNFDKTLLVTYQEIALFRRIGFDIPPNANEVFAKREDMRLLRENVLLVLRDYNSIIEMLSKEERELFRERIRFLDKKIQPGLTKLTWASPGIKALYVMDSRKHAANLRQTVENYLESNRKIAKACHDVANTKLFDIATRRTYKSGEFEADQTVARERSLKKLKRVHRTIVDHMRTTYKVFQRDGSDVQHNWGRYTVKMDRMVELSLKISVKRALVALAQVISGDGKADPHPAFRMNVVLDTAGPGDGVMLSPNFGDLRKGIKLLGDNLSNICSDLPRLPSLLARNVRPRPAYCEVIDADDECTKLKVSIYDGIMSAQPQLETYLATWVKEYSHIWLVKKDPFIKRYASANPPPPLFKFDADISRYDEIANNTEKHENLVAIDYMQVDNSPIKYSIVEHCTEWGNKFTIVLYEKGVADMNELRDFLKNTTTRLGETPETLDQMCETIELLDGTKANLEVMSQRFQPIRDNFEILLKHDVEVEEHHLAEMEGMGEEWQTFLTFLETCTEALEDTRKQFKADLLKDTEGLTKKVHDARKDFLNDGPFSGEVTPEDATAALGRYHQQLKDLRETQDGLATGLRVFGITQAPYKEMQEMDYDLGFLDQLWGLASEFDAKYAEWKVTKFGDIKTDELENEAGTRLKKLVKLQRQVKEKDWDFVQHYRDKLSTFKSVMPLILDLKEPAMRDRHWTKLMEEVGKTFDPKGEDFTLGSMIELDLAAFAEQVADISGSANQELKIEQKIKEIAEVWESSPVAEMIIGEYKADSGHFLLQGSSLVCTAACMSLSPGWTTAL